MWSWKNFWSLKNICYYEKICYPEKNDDLDKKRIFNTEKKVCDHEKEIYDYDLPFLKTHGMNQVDVCTKSYKPIWQSY